MQYYSIQATNLKTKQSLQRQDLTGHKITDYSEAMAVAESFAQKLTARSRETWTAKVVLVGER